MKKLLLSAGLLCFLAQIGTAADYGLPAGIQEGNILHCFNWPAKDIKAALPEIAAAGFGSVQLSPLQRPDAKVGESWHALYRPYDLAFKSSSFCSEQDLKDLCTEAAKYGIKVIVDVVANHVDKTAGYHDTWWDSNGRQRNNGDINYGDRYSITHGNLGDYQDVNSESSEVIARAKSYIEKLKSLGVKGIRWDAAKHIGLPTEGCNFWSTVTSVSGMWHYGEILDNPGPDASIISEYCKYMSVTDNKYCNYAARENGGIAGGYAGAWVANHNQPDTKMVYWAESHDTYANDEWSQNVDQAVIDRAYACYASRNGATALYLSRPNTKGFNNIKVGKGSTHFKEKQVAEVNKFRNIMVGKADWFENYNGVVTVTRKDGGAVIVAKNGGQVTGKNGGGFCPEGTYTDKVSGSTFTVTKGEIKGNVGSSGIAVIYKDGIVPDPNPNPDPNPDPDPDPSGSMWILGNIDGMQWTTDKGAEMKAEGTSYVAKNVKFTAQPNEEKCYFNITDALGADWDELNMTANRYGAATEGVAITPGSTVAVTKYPNGVTASGCLSWSIAPGSYDFTFNPTALTLTVVNAGSNPDPNPNPNPDPDPTPGTLTITGDYNLAYDGDLENVYYWGTGVTLPAWPGVKMESAKGSDGKTYKVFKLPEGVTKVIFVTTGDSDKTADLDYKAGYVMSNTGATSTAVVFKQGDNPDPNPNPDPTPGTLTITGDYNLAYNGDREKVYYWGTGVTLPAWPGEKMESAQGSDGNNYKVFKLPEGVTNVIFVTTGDSDKTADLEYKAGYVMSDAGATSTPVVFKNGDGPVPDQKPVVTASPASGTSFTESVTVKLSVVPSDAKIYYTLNSTAPSMASPIYTGEFVLTETTTIRTLAVSANGTASNTQSFSYTKKTNPGPNPDPVPVTGKNLITDYFKVNPDGKVGSNRTVTMSFNGQKSTTALSNWTEADLIAQGVARDVCQAFKGVHERPIVDSYALYAAYDSENLYLGVQYVYTVWDIGGEGKQPGESKPHNMDGKLCFAFDLDPELSAEGITNENSSIWQNKVYTTFNNGSDAWWYGSTKPGDGIPGFFVPNSEGVCDYSDPNSCKPSTVVYGYADGLLPSIDAIYGQDDFSYDPELLKGNTGFKDLRSEIDDSAHTFYEFTFPLSLLGVTEDYIKTQGIGVMVVDFYGSSAHSSIPYDPSFFDNVNESYSQDPSSSKEKEDQDVVTYTHARVGKAGTPTKVAQLEDAEDVAPVYYNLQGVRVENPVSGLYIRVQGKKTSKVIF